MSTELTTTSNNGATIAAPSFSQEQIDVIKETVAKGASNAQLFMFLQLAGKYNLDPFCKEIWCVNMGGGMTIMASRDGYLKAAQRDPGFDGLKAFVVKEGDAFEVDAVNDTVHHKFGATRGKILGAWAIAYHKHRRPVIVWSEFSEYNRKNNVWNNYPSAMIQKVAEVMALKRQFGINGLVTQEEIGTPDEAYQVNTTTGEVANHPGATLEPPRDHPGTIPPATLSQQQIKRLFAIAKEFKVSNEEMKAEMVRVFGKDSTKQLTATEYEQLCDEIIPGLRPVEPIEEADYTDALITGIEHEISVAEEPTSNIA